MKKQIEIKRYIKYFDKKINFNQFKGVAAEMTEKRHKKEHTNQQNTEHLHRTQLNRAILTNTMQGIHHQIQSIY